MQFDRPNTLLRTFFVAVLLLTLLGLPLFAQQRPLLTEDPRLIPEGTLDTEIGMGIERDTTYTISGLRGTHVAVAQSGLNFGVGRRAEFQMNGAVQDYLKAPDGRWHRDFGDLSLSTKLKILDETSRRPIISFRPTVVLPNANQASGLGLNTTRFFASILSGKTIGKAFVFGNIGLGIIDDPIHAGAQQDVLTGGVGTLLPITSRTRLAVEFNGVQNPRSNPSPGGESHGQARAGFQVDFKGLRLDAGFLAGVTDVDPKAGIVFGATKRFSF